MNFMRNKETRRLPHMVLGLALLAWSGPAGADGVVLPIGDEKLGKEVKDAFNAAKDYKMLLKPLVEGPSKGRLGVKLAAVLADPKASEETIMAAMVEECTASIRLQETFARKIPGLQAKGRKVRRKLRTVEAHLIERGLELNGRYHEVKREYDAKVAAGAKGPELKALERKLLRHRQNSELTARTLELVKAERRQFDAFHNYTGEVLGDAGSEAEVMKQQMSALWLLIEIRALVGGEDMKPVVAFVKTYAKDKDRMRKLYTKAFARLKRKGKGGRWFVTPEREEDETPDLDAPLPVYEHDKDEPEDAAGPEGAKP